MNQTFQNIFAIVIGIIAGSVVNMGLINVSMSLFGYPTGFSMDDPSSFALLGVEHILGVFLAHAVGTHAGAYFTARLAASHHLILALSIGGFFLVAGMASVISIPAPLWFEVMDLTLAYLPMAWLGWKVAWGLK